MSDWNEPFTTAPDWEKVVDEKVKAARVEALEEAIRVLLAQVIKLDEAAGKQVTPQSIRNVNDRAYCFEQAAALVRALKDKGE